MTTTAATTTLARVEGARFLARADGGGCARCSRELTGAYVIALPGGDTVRMGRRCAARTLGWATTAVEMAAVDAEFHARKVAVRRAAGFTLADARALAVQCVTDDIDATAAALHAEVWG